VAGVEMPQNLDSLVRMDQTTLLLPLLVLLVLLVLAI
jgi:hypothetical protein